MNCLNCNCDISGLKSNTGHGSKRKFCTRSCAAKYNNKNPKRKLVRQCRTCSELVRSNRIYCDDCQTRGQARTLGELRDQYPKLAYHAKVRGLARLVYKRSGKPYACRACGYDLHVDICHIRDVKDFPMEAPLSEVNHIDNLVALDKRCHWEFDHGYLTLP